MGVVKLLFVTLLIPTGNQALPVNASLVSVAKSNGVALKHLELAGLSIVRGSMSMVLQALAAAVPTVLLLLESLPTPTQTLHHQG